MLVGYLYSGELSIFWWDIFILLGCLYFDDVIISLNCLMKL